MPELITAIFRYAEPGELSPGRIADIRPGLTPDSVHVIIKPGESSRELLDELTTQQASQMISGRWYRLPDTPANRAHPRRVLHAGWRLDSDLPAGALAVSVEEPQRHVWLIREGHASPLLEAEMTWLIMKTIRTEIWIQRGSA